MREQLLIGGSWRDGAEGNRIDVANPATGEVITSIADGTPADAVSYTHLTLPTIHSV